MPGLVIIGAQWGDEGKGKLVDYLTGAADYVVRFQGGNNAGHTLVVAGQTTKLNLVPSGILHPHSKCVIATGVVIDPLVLDQEITKIRALGVEVTPQRLIIDENAHLVLDYHRILDGAQEDARGGGKIGTTRRGIGPAYVDRAARCGVRMIDLTDLKELRPRLESLVAQNNLLLEKVLGSKERVNFADVWSTVVAAREKFLPYLGNVSLILDQALAAGARVVFEGAQGTLLDQMHGAIPFVSSSNTIAGAVCTGCGLGPKRVDCVLGVIKAYCTRVGSGPFPTELLDCIGDGIRERGHEYGTVTGRPRRCGWFDGVALQRAVRLNGIDVLALMKLDVMSGLEKIRLCTGYLKAGRRVEDMPAMLTEYEQLVPEYVDFEGWEQDLSAVRSFRNLPRAVRNYLAAIENLAGCPLGIVSVGPDRTATLVKREVQGLKHFILGQ